MSGLVLKLQPGEQILVNGVVMQNGDRRAQLRIKTKNAHILRLRDAIHPDDADTPVKRVYYAAQLVVAGEGDPEAVGALLEKDVDTLSEIFRDRESKSALCAAKAYIVERNFYHAMRELKRVIPIEGTLLSVAASNGASDDVAVDRIKSECSAQTSAG
ncbi:MAG: flagellar biosynthesis repressor FlbT [Alphaproteobacteria bacterium]|nr:flagellar biosynthesis repressor FlbT [Alphaproteobacteria bacterium]